MLPSIENIFIRKEEPTQSCLFALHQIVLNHHDEMSEDFKYGMPLISFKGKPFCYLWTDKKSNYPYLLFVDGNKINHPDLEQGDRKRMKTYTVKPHEDIPIDKVKELLDAAIDLYK